MPSRRAQSLNAPLPPPPPAWLAWSAWGLAAFFYLIGFFHRVAPAVITRELMQEFGIGAAALGHLSASYLYSYLVMQVPSGILADRLGPRRLLAGACLAAAAGAAVFALAPGFLLACLGRLMIGGSVAVAFVALLKLASHWMPPRHFALATGMALLVGLLGAASAGAPLRLLVDAMGWRAVSLAIGGLTLVLALAIWLWVRDDPSERGFRSQAPQLAAKRDGAGGGWGGWRGLLACRNLWLLTLAPAGMVGPMLAFAGLWGVPFLVVRHGLEQATAAGICSLQLIAWGVGGPLLGWLSDRVGRRKAPYLTGTLLVALTWPLLLYAPLPLPLHIALTLLNGLATGGMILGFAFAKESCPPELAGTVSGLINAGVMVGPTVLQPAVGWVLDRHWQGALAGGGRVYDLAAYHHAFLLLVAWSLLALVLIGLTRDTRCRQVG